MCFDVENHPVNDFNAFLLMFDFHSICLQFIKFSVRWEVKMTIKMFNSVEWPSINSGMSCLQ